MKTSKVSIIIPVYNVDKYLKRCIMSVLNQEYRNIEIFLVDDGSSDNSPKLCDDFAKSDDRIVVIHKENGGLSSARNAALDCITGEYVTFVDGDDFVAPTMIKELYNLLQSTKSEIAICNEQRFTYNQNNEVVLLKSVYREINGIKQYSAQEALQSILYQSEFDASACGKLYNAKLFEEVRYPVGKIFEDIGTTYQLICRCSNVVFSSEKMYYYLQRQDSLSHKVSRKYILDGVEMVEQEQADVIMCFPELKKSCQCRCLSMYFHGLLTNNNYNDINKILWGKIKRNRVAVLLDGKARKKTRIAALLSFAGINTVKFFFKFAKGRK